MSGNRNVARMCETEQSQGPRAYDGGGGEDILF